MAQFISERRELIGLSQAGLAKKSNLEIITIQNIEAGEELFLATAVRQKLAKGLKLYPAEIKPYEKIQEISFNINEETIKLIKQKILDKETQDLLCPLCKSKLNTRIAKMYDLEDNLVLTPKANCSKCPFQVK